MPKPRYRNDDDRQDAEIEAVLARRKEFRAGFQRSRKGNLWRNWDGLTVSVFLRDDDRHEWCIVDGNENKRYSRRGFVAEEEALNALASELIWT